MLRYFRSVTDRNGPNIGVTEPFTAALFSLNKSQVNTFSHMLHATPHVTNYNKLLPIQTRSIIVLRKPTVN